jgi:predicted DNA repair protein MutK
MSGLLALLDDVAAIAKVAAASLDDAATQAAGATAKAAGIVIDDTAVTPRYVVGFSAERELPIIGKIAWGSIKNKLLVLLPGALILSLFAPWAITPLLMFGGAFLCFEGFEKIMEMIAPGGHGKHAEPDAATARLAPLDGKALEEERISGAIRTDLILSAEIMAIALASVASATLLVKALSLTVVALAVTAGVYGLVALIVKADDVGIMLARQSNAVSQVIGRGLVNGMPTFLRLLSVIGTLAMLWVGGGIVVHSLHEFGVHAPQDAIHSVAVALSKPLGALHGFVEWLVTATLSGLIGLGIGWAVEKVYHAGKSHWPKGPKFTGGWTLTGK